jgi:glutathione S-transferase
LLKAYEALPADVLYPGGEQLSDSDAIAAYLQQRNGATA